MKKLEQLVVLSLVFLMVASLWTPVWAQGGVTLNVEEVTVNESTFPEMSAVVSVMNASRMPIEDLTESDFEIYEGEIPLPITGLNLFEDKGQTLAVALVLDLSLSSPVEEAKAAANWLLDSLGPNDRVALIGFNEPPDLQSFDPAKEVDFTTNKELVRDVVNSFDESSLVGISAVYEAIYKGVYITAQQEVDRRAVIVVTDGYQYGTDQTETESDRPKSLAQSERIPIFTIGVYTPPDHPIDRAYLETLARDTGGRYQETTDPSLLTGFFQDVVGQLGLKYKISFRNPDLPRDGHDHILTFQVSTPDGNDRINKIVRYLEPPPSPEIVRLQQDINGELEELQPKLEQKVMLVPEINARNSIVRVEYFLDEQLTHVVMVDMQEDVSKHEPWEWKWDTCETSAGAHTLTIIVYDDAQVVSDRFSESVEIVRSGICLPGVGSVDNSVVIGIGLILWLLWILIVVLIVMNRRRRAEFAPETVPTIESSTVPSVSPDATVSDGPASDAGETGDMVETPPEQSDRHSDFVSR